MANQGSKPGSARQAAFVQTHWSIVLRAQGPTTPQAAVKMAVMRLRRRHGQLLRAQVAQTVASPEAVEEELRHLFAALAG